MRLDSVIFQRHRDSEYERGLAVATEETLFILDQKGKVLKDVYNYCFTNHFGVVVNYIFESPPGT